MFNDLLEKDDFRTETPNVLQDLDSGKFYKKFRSKSPIEEIRPEIQGEAEQRPIEESKQNGEQATGLLIDKREINLSLDKEVLDLTQGSTILQKDIGSDRSAEIAAENVRKEGVASVTQNNTTLEENLPAYLKDDGDGKLILQHFNDHKSLNPETRSLLTRTIIKKFKDDALRTLEVGQKLAKFAIETKVFIVLAKAIEKLFPGESACTYYSPYKSENGIAIQTSGTLWAHFNYVVEKLRSQNLLERRKSSKNNDKPVLQRQTDEIKVALDTLENSIDPSTCLDAWRITQKSRQFMLLTDKISITDYMNKFPCLKVQGAKQLIELDFDSLKPGKSHLLQVRWPIIKKILINQLQKLGANQN